MVSTAHVLQRLATRWGPAGDLRHGQDVPASATSFAGLMLMCSTFTRL